MTTFK
jgi:hypothetical protein